MKRDKFVPDLPHHHSFCRHSRSPTSPLSIPPLPPSAPPPPPPPPPIPVLLVSLAPEGRPGCFIKSGISRLSFSVSSLILLLLFLSCAVSPNGPFSQLRFSAPENSSVFCFCFLWGVVSLFNRQFYIHVYLFLWLLLWGYGLMVLYQQHADIWHWFLSLCTIYI